MNLEEVRKIITENKRFSITTSTTTGIHHYPCLSYDEAYAKVISSKLVAMGYLIFTLNEIEDVLIHPDDIVKIEIIEDEVKDENK